MNVISSQNRKYSKLDQNLPLFYIMITTHIWEKFCVESKFSKLRIFNCWGWSDMNTLKKWGFSLAQMLEDLELLNIDFQSLWRKSVRDPPRIWSPNVTWVGFGWLGSIGVLGNYIFLKISYPSLEYTFWANLKCIMKYINFS